MDRRPLGAAGVTGVSGEPADGRGRSSQPGIESWHCFSSGPYYDPERISLGPIVGVDEHVVAPGAGFDWHAHRGVQIASWVLEGTLRHEDSTGELRFVPPGALFVQSTGRDGIRHREGNAAEIEALRFVQITVLGEAEYGLRSTPLPATVGGVRVDVRPCPPGAPVAAFEITDRELRLRAGGALLVLTVGSDGDA